MARSKGREKESEMEKKKRKKNRNFTVVSWPFSRAQLVLNFENLRLVIK